MEEMRGGALGRASLPTVWPFVSSMYGQKGLPSHGHMHYRPGARDWNKVERYCHFVDHCFPHTLASIPAFDRIHFEFNGKRDVDSRGESTRTKWKQDSYSFRNLGTCDRRMIDADCRQAIGRTIASTQGIRYSVELLMNPAEEKVATLEMPGPISERTGWLQAVLVVGLIAFIYRHIGARLILQWWNDPNFSHGFFVPLFSLLVFWQNRKELSAIPRSPSWMGLPLMAGALVILTLGVLGAEMFLSRSSLVFLIGSMIVYFFGWPHFRALLFPWAFLFLMIPIPALIFNQIAFPLQLFASQVSSGLLELGGVPVLREGNVIRLPTMTLEVVEACSGIRSLVSLGTLAVMYGYFLESRIAVRVVLALSAIPIAVAANSLRIMGTGVLGYYWDPDKAEGFFHTFSGWVIFVLSLGLLFLVHRLIAIGLRWKEKRAS
jgi:exosortase